MTDVVKISLTKGGVAKIDASDFSAVEPFRWWLVCDGRYAATRIDGHFTYLHNFLMKPPNGNLVDHRNGDGLDCRRANMRIADKTLNGFNRGRPSNNTSGFKGVTWCSYTGRWRASAVLKGRQTHIGRYDKIEDALKARQQWENQHGFRPEVPQP